MELVKKNSSTEARKERLEIDLNKYNQPILEKKSKDNSINGSLFNKWSGKKLVIHIQRNESTPRPYAFHKNSKLMTDLNIRCKTIKFLEDKAGK